MGCSKQGVAAVLAGLTLAIAGCEKATPEPEAAAGAVATEAAKAAPVERVGDELKPGPHDKILTIASSDPSVAVTGVFLDGRPLASAGLGTGTARVLLVADPEEGNGTPCTSEGLEVRLANAIVLRPLANFCNAGYKLQVSAAKAALPSPPPSAPEDFLWEVDGRGSDKMLYFGIPQTDATAFLATCRKGETRAQAKFFMEASRSPSLDLYGPDRLLRYGLVRTSSGSSEEAPTNEVDLSIDDQFWTMLERGNQLTYRIDKGDFLSLDTRAGTAKIAEFIAWCRGD